MDETSDILTPVSGPETIVVPDLPQKSPKELADAKKDEGNNLFKLQKYNDAIRAYTEAIDLSPNSAVVYGNRSACYMQLNNHKAALQDAQKATSLDPNYIKGYSREAKCHLKLGDVSATRRSIESIKKINSSNSELPGLLQSLDSLTKHVSDVEKYQSKNDYRSVIYYASRVLEIANDSIHFKLVKAEALAMSQKFTEAQEIVMDVLRQDSMNVDDLYIRGVVLYYQDNLDKAITRFQQALKFSPDHAKSREWYKKARTLKTKKEEGNNAFKAGKLQEALTLYTDALQTDPTNQTICAKLYFNRALVYGKLNKHQEALTDCSKAIEIDNNYTKAYLKRGKIHQDLEMHEEAVRDYVVFKKEKTIEHKRLLENAKMELKKSLRKDYYKILGVGRQASEDEIKKAYKKRALVHHPDRHANGSEDEKREQEKKFKEIGEAYAVKSDSRKRARYDRGEDDDSGFSSGYGGGADVDPMHMFNAFFNGNQFNFGGAQFTGGHPFNHM